jgi:hypothetical protein
MWAGGPQSKLCATFAPAYARRNHLRLRRGGVRLHGSYLDVFACTPADECFHPNHRMTRRQCLELRAECFGIIRELEGIVSSEEPVDWSVRHLHLSHSAPYQVQQKHDLPRVPLWDLVYHDSMMTPWPEEEKGAVSPLVSAALHGGMPYVDMEATREQIRAAGRLCRLHRKLAFREMVGHELLDAEGRRQRSTFDGGIRITADLRTGRWTVAGDRK